jgi:hypothetical protein
MLLSMACDIMKPFKKVKEKIKMNGNIQKVFDLGLCPTQEEELLIDAATEMGFTADQIKKQLENRRKKAEAEILAEQENERRTREKAKAHANLRSKYPKIFD